MPSLVCERHSRSGQTSCCFLDLYARTRADAPAMSARIPEIGVVLLPRMSNQCGLRGLLNDLGV